MIYLKYVDIKIPFHLQIQIISTKGEPSGEGYYAIDELLVTPEGASCPYIPEEAFPLPEPHFTCNFEEEDNCGFEISATAVEHWMFQKHYGELGADAVLPASDHTGSPTAKYMEADFRLKEDGSGTTAHVNSNIFRHGFSGVEDHALCMSFWYSFNVSL